MAHGQALAATQAEQARLHAEAQATAARAFEAALSQVVEAQAQRISEATRALCDDVKSSVGAEGLRLSEAAGALSQGAGGLASAAAQLAEPLTTLGPALEAMAREVALLADRSLQDANPVALEELARVGEGIDRLEALLQLSRGEPA
jgi:hypothetical protein